MLWNAENGTVSVKGTDMPYVSFGNGKKKLVILPGLSDGLATVKGKALILAPPYRKFFRDYTVYMFSRRDHMPEGYTIRDMAEDQFLAMKILGIDQAYLLGVSQGGMIAQSVAAEYPESVTKLILAVTAPYANDTVRKNVSGWIGMVKRSDHASLMSDTAEKMYSEKYLRKNRKYFPLLAMVTKPRSYDRFLKNADAILTCDCRSELPKICCPTLIIAGSDDHTVGNKAAYELNSAIPDSSLYVYEGLGHGAYEEAEDFYDRILEFCEK